ncbi:unnamed protein product [marine sediment metagenome]|uniref:Uncharacterized protein n=1 Tax=marine sediment metagenome TaxID=412755 RepID=X1PJZ6_9ZZZZ
MVPNFVLITTPHPIMLKTKENSEPIIGIKPIKLTRIKPRKTAKNREGCFPPKALEMLSPKK